MANGHLKEAGSAYIPGLWYYEFYRKRVIRDEKY
jgi:hypothetical protein